MGAPVRRLPVVAHADVTAPSDFVHCAPFSAILRAAECAARSLARKSLPGRRERRTGPALHARCTRCEHGATTRAALGIGAKTPPVEDTGVARLSFDDEVHPPRPSAPGLTPADIETLRVFGWTRDGAAWIDPHGTRFSEAAAAIIAGRERALVAMSPAARAGLSGAPCATPECAGRVRGAQAKTPAVLVDRCPTCRQYAKLAMSRGTAHLSTLVEWLAGYAARKAAA